MYAVHAPYQPEVNGELDTQNFEQFDEDDAFAKKQRANAAASRKDLDFIGYTYKNFEVVGEEVQKKKGKVKPSLASIFPGAVTPEPKAAAESESSTPYHTAQFHGLAEEGEEEAAAAAAAAVDRMSVADP